MAQLYFIFSTMNSGKSLDLLKTAHNYESQGKKVLMFTSRKDTRSNPDQDSPIGKISTRIGLEREAYLIENVDCFELASKLSPDCILVDEAQFLDKSQVLKLAQIVDELGIPVICYGLKNDFQNNLFEGSAALLLYADKIQEMKTVCWYCNRKATMNMRLKDGKPVFEGNQIEVGGSQGDEFSKKSKYSYVPVCRKHYMIFKNSQEGSR